MFRLPQSIESLIDEFARLPGIGPKTASRLVFYLLNQPEQISKQFGKSLLALRENLKICQDCYNIGEEERCAICLDKRRDKSIIMAVEEPLDIIALDKTDYQGKYHVLGGVISPIDGIGPEDLRIAQLLERLRISKGKKSSPQELILATNPSLEGEATALFIAKEISALKEKKQISQKLKVTRIARGLPAGGDLEYADEETLGKALQGRIKY